MKFKRWLLYGLLIAFALLGARWAIAVSEIGARPFLRQWSDVFQEITGDDNRALSELPPVEQGHYWLGEVAQVEEVQSDPEVAMGAAWLLDAPQYNCLLAHYERRENPDGRPLPPFLQYELDRDTAVALTEEFESLCRDECLAQIELAVRLDESNVESRRAQALLLFQPRILQSDIEPRREDWLAILEECADHDPDNALYDYLAAYVLWDSAAKYDWDTDGFSLTIENQDAYELGDVRFAAGLAKAHLKFGETGYAATVSFLRAASQSDSWVPPLVASRRIETRAQQLLYRLFRWQAVRRDSHKRNDNPDAAHSALQNLLHISAQFSNSENYSRLGAVMLDVRRLALGELEELYAQYPELVSQHEVERVSNDLIKAQLDQRVWKEAEKQITADANRAAASASAFGSMTSIPDRLLDLFLLASAQYFLIVAGLLALAAWATTRIARTKPNPGTSSLGWVRHLVVWLFSIGISFVLLGMGPALIIPEAMRHGLIGWLLAFAVFISIFTVLQRAVFREWFAHWLESAAIMSLGAFSFLVLWHNTAIARWFVFTLGDLRPLTTTMILVAVGLLSGAMGRLFYRRVRNWTIPVLHKMLAIVMFFALGCVALPLCQVLGTLISDTLNTSTWFTPSIWTEAAWRQQSAETLPDMGFKFATWFWAFFEWESHHGAVVASLAAGLGVILWQLRRSVTRHEGPWWRAPWSQKLVDLLDATKAVARSCLAVALLSLLVYMGASPTAAKMVQTYQDQYLQRMVDSSWASRQRALVIQQFESNGPLMAQWKFQVKEQNRRIAQQNP